MKILHISRTMGQGGAEKVVYQLCKDCNIESFVASSGGAYVAQLKKIGIKHCKINDIANKNPFVFSNKFHFRCLRMELTLTTTCLNRKGLFIPRFYTVSAHKYW